MTELRIVLVDDSPAERELAEEACAEFAPDVELTTASSRAELFAILATEPFPHLVLLDLHLGPELGNDIVQEIQQHPAHLVPVVILTTTEDTTERSRCLAAGAVDFWLKPVHFSDYPDLLDHARELADLCRKSGLLPSMPTKK